MKKNFLTEKIDIFLIHMDYPPIEGCGNPDSYGRICVKCNICGRFNKIEREYMTLRQLSDDTDEELRKELEKRKKRT